MFDIKCGGHNFKHYPRINYHDYICSECKITACYVMNKEYVFFIKEKLSKFMTCNEVIVKNILE